MANLTVSVRADGSFVVNSALRIGVDGNNLVDTLLFKIPELAGSGWVWFVKIEQGARRGKVLLTETADGVLWTVCREDVRAGDIKLQLQAERQDGANVLTWQSYIVNATVLRQIEADETIEREQAPYLQELDLRVAAAAGSAEAARDALLAPGVTVTQLASDALPTAEWDLSGDRPVLVLGIPASQLLTPSFSVEGAALILTTPDGYEGPGFGINSGNLEVVDNG
jgi:hypothetical protein